MLPTARRVRYAEPALRTLQTSLESPRNLPQSDHRESGPGRIMDVTGPSSIYCRKYLVFQRLRHEAARPQLVAMAVKL
jgi:hypothetical protein